MGGGGGGAVAQSWWKGPATVGLLLFSRGGAQRWSRAGRRWAGVSSSSPASQTFAFSSSDQTEAGWRRCSGYRSSGRQRRKKQWLKTKPNQNDTKEKIIHMLHCCHILGIRSLYGAAVAGSLQEFSVFDLCKFAKLFIAFYQKRDRNMWAPLFHRI